MPSVCGFVFPDPTAPRAAPGRTQRGHAEPIPENPTNFGTTSGSSPTVVPKFVGVRGQLVKRLAYPMRTRTGKVCST